MRDWIRFGKVVIALMIAVGSATPLDARMPNAGWTSARTPTRCTTKSAKAGNIFDQGLKLMFGFDNHGAAIRSFKEAAKLDPECAMAHWGVALANGPHINLPIMTPPMVEEAWAELQLAKKHAANATPTEQALIGALGHRSPIRSRRTARRWISLTLMRCARFGKSIREIPMSECSSPRR